MILIIKNIIMKKYYIAIIVLLIIYNSLSWYEIKQNQDIQESQKELDATQQELDSIHKEIQKDLDKLKQERNQPEKKEKAVAKENKVLKLEWPETDPRQDLINYAYNLGWKDFVLTLEGENGLWTVDRRSMMIWKNWHYDYWLCQLNTRWHGEFVSSKEFQDPYKQLDYCFWVWQDAIKKWRLTTTFYAYNVRNRYIKRFVNLK